MVFLSGLFGMNSNYESISMEEFAQLEKSSRLNIVDVRENHEQRQGCIKGVTSLPLSAITSGHTILDKSKKYYVICFSGSRSAKACKFLSKEGYQVVNVMGGMSSWRGSVVLPKK